jgi:hypothetical protein
MRLPWDAAQSLADELGVPCESFRESPALWDATGMGRPRWRTSSSGRRIRRGDSVPARRKQLTVFFHKTFAAEAILKGGFKGRYTSGPRPTGIWLSDRPLDIREGAAGDVTLTVKLPESLIRKYEVEEEGNPYREWCVPPKLLNEQATVRVHDSRWAGLTEAELLQTAAWKEKFAAQYPGGSEDILKEVARIREIIPFLKEHGLLAKPKRARRE